MEGRKPYLGLLALTVCLFCAAVPSTREEQLAQARNLGKAFYENPTTGAEAVAEFKKALDLAPNSNREKLNYGLALLKQGDFAPAVALLQEVQKADPTLPHTWFNLGIYDRKNGDAEEALAQFRQMVRLAPEEPIAHYQLGALYRQTGDRAQAIAEFERTEQLNPLLAAAHFQLYNLYRQAGRTADATRELSTFQDLKKQQENAAIPEDVDWCQYAEIYDPPVKPAALAPETTPQWEDRVLTGTVDASTAGMTLLDSTGKGDTDLLVWSARGISLYRRGSIAVTDSSLAAVRDVLFVAPGDFDNDGLMDLCVLTTAGPRLFRNTGGKFAGFAADLPQRRFERAVWIDYDHDYDLDLLLLGDSPALVRNQGGKFADRTGDFPFVAGRVTDAWKTRITPDTKAFDLIATYAGHPAALYRDLLGGHYRSETFEASPRNLAEIEADFTATGKPDRVQVAANGAIHVRHNRAILKHHWIRTQLTGVRSLKLAQDAEVEIKAGSLYRKQWYDGTPLLFDAGDYTTIDTVRITWPNGLIQNEIRQPVDKTYHYKEAQRLSGSCPMIWTWNGRMYQFIADILGVAPLGASDGDGAYFPVNDKEHLLIPGKALQAVNGRFDVRITEELSEVSYLDRVELYAIDHPAGTDVFTNDKFQSPPYPPLHFYQTERRIYPQAARDDKGHDALAEITKTDGIAPRGFKRTPEGQAEMHSLELDFSGSAPSGSATLLLHGWVDWADGSVFRAASQESPNGLVLPYLQMQDEAGEWRTVDVNMGLPSGKPRTIAVDLRFLSSRRKLRIVTNMCVYWDEIFLSENAMPEAVQPVASPLVSADLHFRGFSAVQTDPARLQPDTYSYFPVSATSFWNPTPGYYTRYGDVRELLSGVDDRPVIMGSGDEIRLGFAADTLPQVRHGWVRDYMLKVDGWAKDRDPNTAFSSTVEPLPFHGMSSYPYPKNEHFPDDEAHRQYRSEYNTRPALRLLRPLSESSSGGRGSDFLAAAHQRR